MCGIAGIYSVSDGVSKEYLEIMSKRLEHRGPDGCGIKIFDKCGLVHRRLSIIDLSENASQPMCNEDETLWLVFNGEIYNYPELRAILIERGHTFRSETDSEVIIHSYEEWGTDCTKKFNGMWAFALYDTQTGKLFCSRDRFGVKPFYYTYSNGDFFFASEIKALAALPDIGKKPCDEKLNEYLIGGTLDTDEKTMFEGILQLRPATNMLINGTDEPVFEKYWDLKVSPAISFTDSKCDDEKAAAEFLDLLRDSVRLRLRSDVSVGTCLSGGLDSSTITVLINEIIKSESVSSVGERQNTFSACYSDPRFDESTFMDCVIDASGVSAHKTYPQPEEIVPDLERLIYMQDEPFNSLSTYSQYRVMKLAGNHVKVILDGQGADEQLAGYLGYQAAYIKSLNCSPVRMLSEILGSIRHHGFFFLNALIQLNLRKKRRSFIRSDAKAMDRYGGTLDEVLQNEILNSNLQALLHYEDRNSMAFSIESRVPFLDYRFVEYTASLPLNQKIRGGVTKYVLRNAIRGIVPEKIRNRMDKMGFVTPEEVWMGDNLYEFVSNVFESESFHERKYWDAEKVEEEFRKYHLGKSGYSPEFWRVLCAELWLRIFFDQNSCNNPF
ncbi:MAG: asparagine synthase (glutamine-hydrolyzing) [Methanomicrobium sp.]|nr:asparagine synthase (glutamine-hydrolyzing) [Methanomicrobium sp.]